MFKVLNKFLHFYIIANITIFIVNSVYKYLDYLKYPEIYELNSAPWYLSIQVQGIFTLISILICLGLKYIINNKIKNDL